MVRLTERSLLSAPAESIWEFLINLDSTRYQAWHPVDHVGFGRRTPARDDLGTGQKVHFKERIGPRTFGFSCTVTKSVPGRYVEFLPTGPARMLHLGRGCFTIAAGPAGTNLEAVVELGWDVAGVGSALDWVVGRVLDLNALRRHMREEAEYLETYLASAAG